MKTRIVAVLLIIATLLMGACDGAPATETALPMTEEPPLPTEADVELPELATATSPPPTPLPPTDVPPTAEPTSSAPSIRLYDLFMMSTSRGYAIITYGDITNRVMRTTDGGETWIDITPESAPTTTAELYFLDESRGWVAYRSTSEGLPASAYTIWRTIDGGETWLASAPINMSDIAMEGIGPTGFFFLNAQTGWFRASLGGGMNKSYPTIYRTTNGGQSWSRMMDPYTDFELLSFSKTGMVFSDSSYGWVTRDSRGVEWGVYVQVTEDGGATWSSIALPEPTDAPGLYEGGGWCGAYYPELTGYGRGSLVSTCEQVEDGETFYRTYLYTTTNGGATWTYQNMPPGELFRFPGTLVVAGRTIYQSTDGGENWNRMSTVDFYPGEYSFVDPLHGWAMVTWEDDSRDLMRTTDGGVTWTPTSLTMAMSRSAGAEISNVDITEVMMADAARGWAIGARAGENDRILVTADGGNRWIDVTPPESLLAGGSEVRALAYFLDADHAWVTFSEPYSTPSEVVIWHTSDGGESWTSGELTDIASLISSYSPYHMFFLDANHGWYMAAVDAGMQKVYSVIYATSNGGATWTRILDPYTDLVVQSFDKTGMVFADTTHGWITYNGRGVEPGLYVRITGDGGVTWTASALLEPSGEPGLFNSSVCGTYWPVMTSPTSGSVIGRCGDYSGDETSAVYYIYSTTDGGASWTYSPYPGGQLIGFNPTQMYAMGEEMYASTDAGSSWDLIKIVSWEGQFSFVDAEHGWAVARAGEEIALVRTDDGGENWDLLEYRVFAGE